METKNVATLRFMLLLALSLSMFSCKKSSSSKNSSRATGWKINAKEGGKPIMSDGLFLEPRLGCVIAGALP